MCIYKHEDACAQSIQHICMPSSAYVCMGCSGSHALMCNMMQCSTDSSLCLLESFQAGNQMPINLLYFWELTVIRIFYLFVLSQFCESLEFILCPLLPYQSVLRTMPYSLMSSIVFWLLACFFHSGWRHSLL